MSQESFIKTDSLKSDILHKTKKFNIYLPKDYKNSNQEYPVIYLLHGFGGDYTDWVDNGNVKATTDKAISDSILPNMIIVMPDGEGTYYMNNINKGYEYEDFFFNELIPYINTHYNTLTDKTHTGIAGLSMGGFGSLLYAFHHTNTFVAAAALSPAVRTDDEIIALSKKSFYHKYGTAFGDPINANDRINSFYNGNSILYLAAHNNSGKNFPVKLYIDIGDDDYLAKGSAMLHITLKDQKIPHEYRVRDGGHTWEYWRTGLLNALTFISNNFN